MRQNMKYQDLTLLLVHHYCTSNFLFYKKGNVNTLPLQNFYSYIAPSTIGTTIATITRIQIAVAILFWFLRLKKFILMPPIIITKDTSFERRSHMPIFLICIIVFVIWFRVKIKKANKETNIQNAQYWEREEQANFARKKDITNLEYLTVDDNELMLKTPANDEEADLIQQLKDCSHRKMLNLSAYSNTDLKEKYGVVNLEELSNCDQNYLYFIRALSNWGRYLYEHDDPDRAQKVMELSLRIGSDISHVYTILAQIYLQQGKEEKVDELIAKAASSDMALKDSLIRKLKLLKLES